MPDTADAQDDCADLLGCQWCVNATETVAHKFSLAGANSCNNDEINPYHDNWVYNATCDQNHGKCYIERFAEHSAQVRVFIASGDMNALAKYDVSYPGQVTVNFERKAVQLHHCGGQVVGHLPLTDNAMKGVSVALAEQMKQTALGGRPALGAVKLQAGSFVEYLGVAALH